MNPKLILNDGTEYSILEGRALRDLSIVLEQSSDLADIYDKLTDENLAFFKIIESPTLISTYTNYTCISALIHVFDGQKIGVFDIEAKGTEEDPSVIERIVTVVDPISEDKAEGYDILTGEVE